MASNLSMRLQLICLCAALSLISHRFVSHGDEWVPAIAAPMPTQSPVPRQPLSSAEIKQRLQTLSGWRTDGRQLFCNLRFSNFVQAVGFVNRLVEPAEALGHHPDITIAYNQVTLRLTTHDAGGITNQDFELARRISQLAALSSFSPASTCNAGSRS